MLALPFQKDHLVCYSKINYTVTNKPSQGAFLEALGDRLHRHRQAFPWYPSQSTKDRLHKCQTSLPLVPISDYTRTLTTPRQMSFPLEPLSQSTRRQTTKADQLPLELLPKHQGTDYIKKTNRLIADLGFIIQYDTVQAPPVTRCTNLSLARKRPVQIKSPLT